MIKYNTIQYNYYVTGLLSDNGLVQLADIETYTSRMAYRRSEAITGSKLPSSREMLSRFSYLHTVQNKTVQESAAATAKEIIQFWEKSCIATRQQYHIIIKIKQHNKWQGLKIASSRRTETQQHKENEFTSVLENFAFDKKYRKTEKFC